MMFEVADIVKVFAVVSIDDKGLVVWISGWAHCL
jgi:hypothetical protein